MATQEERLDVICLGRIAVDFYADQIGARLEEASIFSKYLGGSSSNVAYGTAIQGLFYRENCADMALTPDDIDESYIASSRALAITGSHL